MFFAVLSVLLFCQCLLNRINATLSFCHTWCNAQGLPVGSQGFIQSVCLLQRLPQIQVSQVAGSEFYGFSKLDDSFFKSSFLVQQQAIVDMRFICQWSTPYGFFEIPLCLHILSQLAESQTPAVVGKRFGSVIFHERQGKIAL